MIMKNRFGQCLSGKHNSFEDPDADTKRECISFSCDD